MKITAEQVRPVVQENTKLIPLTQGKFAIVDADDYEWLMQWKWYARQCVGTWYAERTVNKINKVKMHRLILGLSDPKMFVDHINGDGLDNTRGNLRMATITQNNRNHHRAKTASGFVGVHFHKASGKFAAHIRVDGKSKHLGLFLDARDAAVARDKAAINLHGEFASLNFREEQ